MLCLSVSLDYVVGVPRGRQLQGKVVIYRQNLTTIDTIRGEQVNNEAEENVWFDHL